MNLGLAIFLSAVFLGTVALYIATMDRWNWKKILIRPLLGVLLLLVLGGVGLLLWVYWPQAEKTTQTFRPEEVRRIYRTGELVTEIPLGSSKADVRFLKGEPSSELPDRWRYTASFPKLPKGFELENSRDLTGPHLLIYFNDEKVHAVLCGGTPGQGNVFEVRAQERSCSEAIGKNSEQITTSYGEPSEIKKSKDDLTRTYLFPQFKEMLVLETNRVVFAGTYDPDVEAPIEFF